MTRLDSGGIDRASGRCDVRPRPYSGERLPLLERESTSARPLSRYLMRSSTLAEGVESYRWTLERVKSLFRSLLAGAYPSGMTGWISRRTPFPDVAEGLVWWSTGGYPGNWAQTPHRCRRTTVLSSPYPLVLWKK